MSGYGLATVVVGRGAEPRAQARIAVEHGRPVILTSLVVQGNDWARALVGRPGVHVAGRLQAVLDVVDQLIGEPAAVGAALSRLAPS
jgi:DNA processing protein